jgi:ubiquinone/menaquinone biosynthesis C-methylase UbiE
LLLGDEINDNHHSHAFHYFHDVSKQFEKAIDENRKYFEADKAIDLGAGGGSFSRLLSKYVKKLYCVDVSDEAIEAMKESLAGIENIEILKVKEDSLPFDNSSIDLVFAANSFHDLPNNYEKEISRVLKSGGKFVDIDWKKEHTMFGPPLGIRLSEAEVITKLELCSLKAIKTLDLSTHYMLVFSKA